MATLKTATREKATLKRVAATAGAMAALLGGSAAPAAASVPGKAFTQTQCPGDTDSVARLYTAGLGRQPERGGFEFWVEEYTSGNWTFPRMAQFFVESDEFQASYGTLDDEGFVRQLYRNVLGREGESGGVTFWLGQMADGMDRATVLMRFAESPENITNSGTTQPTLGEFNEGRAPGAWYCGPPMDAYLMSSADWPGALPIDFAEWNVDEPCVAGLLLPDPSPGAGLASESGDLFADHELYHYATPLGAERWMDGARAMDALCFVPDARGLSTFAKLSLTTVPSDRVDGGRPAVGFRFDGSGGDVGYALAVQIDNVISVYTIADPLALGVDEQWAVERVTALSDRVAADLGKD